MLSIQIQLLNRRQEGKEPESIYFNEWEFKNAEELYDEIETKLYQAAGTPTAKELRQH